MTVHDCIKFFLVPEWHGSMRIILHAQEGPESWLTQSQTQRYCNMAHTRDGLVVMNKSPHPIKRAVLLKSDTHSSEMLRTTLTFIHGHLVSLKIERQSQRKDRHPRITKVSTAWKKGVSI